MSGRVSVRKDSDSGGMRRERHTTPTSVVVISIIVVCRVRVAPFSSGKLLQTAHQARE